MPILGRSVGHAHHDVHQCGPACGHCGTGCDDSGARSGGGATFVHGDGSGSFGGTAHGVI